jgi:hypothetical protein
LPLLSETILKGGLEKRPTPDGVVRLLAALCPMPSIAQAIRGRLTPMLSAASLFISPRVYSRFVVSSFALPLPFQALSLLLLPIDRAALIAGALAVVQAMPILVLVSRASSRKRSADAELPFFLMTLSVLVHEASPTLQEGFRRVTAIGPRVFPAFSKEGEILARDDAFVPGSPMGIAERAFQAHPSARVRGFIQGFLKTLSTGREVTEFVRLETSFQVQRLEQSWTSFSTMAGSLAEVTFMLMALFPVGLEMVGAVIPGFSSSLLFLASFALLGIAAAVFLALTDSIQPVVHDSPPSAVWLVATLLAWAASTAAFATGLLGARECVIVPLCVSVLGYWRTRKENSRVRRGEEEVGAMLHDLAEESRAGVSLPEAMTSLATKADSFSSIKESVLTFHQSTRLGLTPTDAQKRVEHPSWLVRVGFAILSIAFETGAGFEHLEELSALFRRVADSRRSVAQSMVPFMLVGAIVPVISVAAITFLAGFSQQGAPIGLPMPAVTSQATLILSVSAVSMLSGLLLSKLLTQTVRHEVAFPVLMASTLVSLFAFGVV